MTADNSQASSKTKFSSVDLMLIGMSFVWGINFSIVKIALADLSPLTLNAIRFSIASTLLLILLWIREQSLSIRREDVSRFVLLALIGNTVYEFIFINGIARTTAGNSSLILATTPIFIALLSSILGVEKVERRIWQSVILSFIGIVLIVLGGGKAITIANQSWVGDLLILAGAICWSTYTVLSKPLLKRYTPLKLTTLTIAIGTPPLILLSIPSIITQDFSSVSTEGLLSLLYSSCLAIAIGYVIWYTGVKRIGSARTALYDNLMTVIAVAVAWVILSESMTPLQIVGAALVFVSLYLARGRGKVIN